MSSIQFEELTMFYTHEKNDMSNQNNIIVNDCIFISRKDYMSNQKPQWCISFTPSFQPFKCACSPLCFVSCFAVNSTEKFVESGM